MHPLTSETQASQASELFAWVAEQCGGVVVHSTQTAGGNRCQSWAIDVARPDGTVAEVFLRYAPPRPPSAEPYTLHREAQVYRAIAGAGLQAPLLLAEHPAISAVLTERARGIAEFRRLGDAGVKQAIASELMHSLARLHRMGTAHVALDGGGPGPRIADHVRTELDIWQAMYRETGEADALLDLAFGWLRANLPDPEGAPVVLDGLGSVRGAYIGGFIVGLTEAFAGFYLDPALKHAVLFGVFIAVLVVRPSGLFGQVGAEEVGLRGQA